MIESHELKRRDIYLNKLIGFRDTEPVKVVTGIRRCGKSTLMEIYEDHLRTLSASYEGAQKVLRQWGLRRAPTVDEEALYTKWSRDWGF